MLLSPCLGWKWSIRPLRPSYLRSGNHKKTGRCGAPTGKSPSGMMDRLNPTEKGLLLRLSLPNGAHCLHLVCALVFWLAEMLFSRVLCNTDRNLISVRKMRIWDRLDHRSAICTWSLGL